MLMMFMIVSPASASSPDAGTLNPNFTTNFASSGGPTMFYTAAAEQPDGKIVVGGEHQQKIKRLNADGTVDSAFLSALGTGFNNAVTSIVIQPSGGIIVSGLFTQFNGTSVGPVVRLTSSGQLDVTFSTNAAAVIGQPLTGTGLARARAVTVSSGKIFVGGTFSGGSASGNNLVQLNENGTLANSSYSMINGPVETLLPLSDGSILAGGLFTGWGLSSNVMRIDSYGLVDTSFGQTLGGPNDVVTSLGQTANGDIYIGGAFTAIAGTSVGRLAKASSSGVLDTTFNTNLGTGFDDTVNAVVPQRDGKIFVVGQFQNFNSSSVGFAAQLMSSGNLDPTFMTNFGSGLNNANSKAILLSTGNILAFGRFSQVNANIVNYLAALRVTPTYTLRYEANGGTGTVPANETFLTSTTVSNASALSRAGFTFLRWNTAQAGTGTSYFPAVTYSATTDATLWAVWQPITYAVTYETGAGGSSVNAGGYETGGHLTLASAPTRSGYTFTHWTITDSDASTHQVNAGATYSPVGYGNISAVANWATVSSPTLTPTQESPISNGSQPELDSRQTTGLAQTGLKASFVTLEIADFLIGLGFVFIGMARKNQNTMSAAN